MFPSNPDWLRVVAYAKAHGVSVRVGHTLYTITRKDASAYHGVTLFFAAYSPRYDGGLFAYVGGEQRFEARNMSVPRIWFDKGLRDKYLMKLYHYARTEVPIDVVGQLPPRACYCAVIFYQMSILYQLPKVKS